MGEFEDLPPFLMETPKSPNPLRRRDLCVTRRYEERKRRSNPETPGRHAALRLAMTYIGKAQGKLRKYSPLMQSSLLRRGSKVNLFLGEKGNH